MEKFTWDWINNLQDPEFQSGMAAVGLVATGVDLLVDLHSAIAELKNKTVLLIAADLVVKEIRRPKCKVSRHKILTVSEPEDLGYFDQTLDECCP